MTLEQQRIAIAEALEWTEISPKMMWGLPPNTFDDGTEHCLIPIPDLLNDLREAREKLAAVTDQRDVANQCHKWCYEDRKRIIEDLTTMTEQRDRLAEEVGQLKSRLTQTMGAVTISRNGYVQELEQQRDRLAEVMTQILNTQMNHTRRELLLEQALQSLPPKP